MSKADLTRNQRIVFAALDGAPGPLSAYEILNLRTVRRLGLTAPQTIYRALEKLQKHGLVHRIESLNAFVACTHKPHADAVAFMICDQCGQTVELPLGSCEPLLREKAAEQQFQLGSVNIEIHGQCSKCA
jgi:Fur family zinc uptake transcriptional regulator